MTIPGLRFVLMVAGFSLLAFRDPIWAMASVLFEYYNHSRVWWWGNFLPSIRWTFYISAFALAMFMLHSERYKHRPIIQLKHIHVLLALLALMHLRISPLTPGWHWSYAEKDFKNLLFALALGATISTPGRYRLMIWVVVTGTLGFGLEATFNTRQSGGRLIDIGGPDSGADNYVAAQMAWCVPFLINFMVRGVLWEKLLAFAAGPFVLNGIILTGSRGGFLALATGSAAYCFLSLKNMRTRKAALFILVAGSAVFFSLIDDPFRKRTQRLIEGEDVTGAGRTVIWSAGLRMVADNPLGLGGGGFIKESTKYIPRRYLTQGAGRGRSTHNTYLTSAADYGLHCFALWMYLLVLMGRRFWRTWKEQDKLDAPGPLGGDALATGCAFITMLTSFMFGEHLHRDYFFWTVALTTGMIHCSAWVGARMEEGEPGLAKIREDGEVVDQIRLMSAALFLFFSITLLYAVGFM